MTETQTPANGEAPVSPPAASVQPSVDAAAIESLNQNIRSLINVANASQRQPAAKAPEPEPDDELDPVEIEALPRAELIRLIVDRTLKAVDRDVVTPLRQQMQSISASTSQHQITGEVVRLGGEQQPDGTFKGGKYPDFFDFREEMLAIARENPGLAPERLYHLARAEHSGKAAKIDEKLRPKAPDGGAPKKIKLGFSGMTPGQSGTGSRSRKMSGTEAAEAAWAETVAAMGGEPDFGGE